MEKKYYTPKIEEFYCGFEYENEVYNEHTDSFDWQIRVFPDEYKLTSIDGEPELIEFYCSNLKTSRVKYLDKEDIKECGFKQVSEDNYLVSTFFKDDYFIITSDFKDILINKIDEHNKISNSLFIGTIKNKSELKRVLKMLNL